MIIVVWLISLFLPFSRILVDNRANVEKLCFPLIYSFRSSLTVVSLFYFWIFKAARKQSREIRRESHRNFHENSTQQNTSNYKAIKTIGFVLGVFIVSCMPSIVVSVVDYVTASDKCVDHDLTNVVWPWIDAMAFTSSAITATRVFTVSEMESFEILYTSVVIAVHVFNQEILQIAVWNQIRLKFLARCFMLARH